MSLFRPRFVVPSLGLAVLLAASPAFAQTPDDPALQPSEIKPLAAHSLLLDVAHDGETLFAAGERGHVLRSVDGGTSWTQLEVPTRLALTAVAAVGGHVWVAGHSGQILASADNGATWTRQRLDVWTPESVAFNAGAPILDVHFTDAMSGFAVGAFSTLLRTRDGGATWEALSLKTATTDAAAEATAPAENGANDWIFSPDELMLEQEIDPHLNAIVATPDGALYIAGERGAMFRSADGGDRWERLDFPYDGSMFGLLALGEGHVLTFGLRGHVFETTDGGQSWAQLETGTEATLQGGVTLPQGGALIVGNEGVVLRRDSGAVPLRLATFKTDDGKTPVLAAVLAINDRVLVIGEEGVGHHGR